VWLALAGGRIALGGSLSAIAGPQAAFPTGVLLIAAGTAVMSLRCG
jgi:hypothetical protein